MPKVDNPSVEGSKATHRYVTVPDTDMFDMPHPAIKINGNQYGPGTHYLDNASADTVEDRLKAYNRGNLRIMQPKKDTNAEQVVDRGRGSATVGF